MFFRKNKKEKIFENITERLNYDSESFDYNKERSKNISDSDMNINDKLSFLDINRKFNYLLSDNIKHYGMTLLNIFQHVDEDDFGEEGVDGYGNTFIDFLDSDNNFAFDEIEKIINSNNKNINKELLEKFKLTIFVRNTLLDIYLSIPEPSDDMDDINELILLLHKFIATCAFYGDFKSKEISIERDEYLNDQFDMVKVLFYNYLEDYSYKDDRKNWQKYIEYIY